MSLIEAMGKHRLESAFVNVPDFPRPGFNYPGITRLLQSDVEVFRACIDELVNTYTTDCPDRIVCIESFGYLFGAPLAYFLRRPMSLARRPGKLPRSTVGMDYGMCYDPHRRLELHKDAIARGERIVIVDDFLASGGTALATAQLVRQLSGVVVDVACNAVN